MKRNARGKLIPYMMWPLFLTVWWLIIAAALLFFSEKAAITVLIATILYFAATLVMYLVRRKSILKDYINFSMDYGDMQTRLLNDLELPYAVLDSRDTSFTYDVIVEYGIGIYGFCTLVYECMSGTDIFEYFSFREGNSL